MNFVVFLSVNAGLANLDKAFGFTRKVCFTIRIHL